VRRDEEYLRFQIDEIRALNPAADEIETLSLQERRLRNATRIQESLLEALQLIEEGGNTLQDRLTSLRRLRERLERLGGEPWAIP